jgi:methylated-DNA-protein-cysteine methyltransferase related protein
MPKQETSAHKQSTRITSGRKVAKRNKSITARDRVLGESAGRQTAANKTARVVHAIRSLPRGKVSTYGAIAAAAGWPGASRQVVRILRQVPGLPWHRVVGAGGAIKIPGEGGAEQRFRLRMEGVAFLGQHVDMRRFEFRFARAKSGRRRN